MPVPTRSEWLQEGLRSNRWMFISGCPRSGTTIMIQAFAGLPNIQATNIGVFPTQVPAIYRNAPEDLRAAIEFLLAFNVVDYVDHRQRSRSDAIADSIAGRLSLRELIRAIGPHPSGAKPRQISALICKEPFLAFAPDLVERALPASCHLFLTRDGRDAADSLVRTYNILSDADLIDPRSNEVMQGRWRGRYCVPWWSTSMTKTISFNSPSTVVPFTCGAVSCVLTSRMFNEVVWKNIQLSTANTKNSCRVRSPK